MLSIGVVGDAGYYLGMVADGVEEYYANEKEAPGVWIGRSVERLGLMGEVGAEELHLVLDHRDPRTATRLTRAQGGPKVLMASSIGAYAHAITLESALAAALTLRLPTVTVPIEPSQAETEWLAKT